MVYPNQRKPINNGYIQGRIEDAFRCKSIAESCVDPRKKRFWYSRLSKTKIDLERLLFVTGDELEEELEAQFKELVWFRGEVHRQDEMPHKHPAKDELEKLSEAELFDKVISMQNVCITKNDVHPKQNQIAMKMNPHYLQICLEDDIKTVGVIIAEDFNRTAKELVADKSNTIYTFKTEMSHEVGDIVIVDTQKGARTAMVVEVHEEPEIEEDSTYHYKWVVQKYDAKRAKELDDRDKAFIEELRREKKRAHREQVRERFRSGAFALESKPEKNQDCPVEDDEDDMFG